MVKVIDPYEGAYVGVRDNLLVETDEGNCLDIMMFFEYHRTSFDIGASGSNHYRFHYKRCCMINITSLYKDVTFLDSMCGAIVSGV